MKNKNKLKFLFVNCLLPDVKLAEKHLKKSGIDFSSLRVETRNEFINALTDFEPDLILSDLKPYAFDFKNVLLVIQEVNKSIPVVVLTDVLNEAGIVECLKLGAIDYVTRKNIARLPQSVHDALKNKSINSGRESVKIALKESRDTFRHLFEASTDPILLLDDSGFIDCNRSTVSILGFASKKEVIGKKPWELSPGFQPDGSTSQNSARKNIEFALQKGHHRFEWTHLKSNGDELQVEVMLTPILLDHKQLFYVVWRDITERKKAEESLKSSEEKYRSQTALLKLYYDLPFIGMAITSPETKKWLLVNEKLCEIFGYTRSELLQKTWAEITYPDDLDMDVTEFEKVLNGKSEGYSIDKRFIKKDGKVIYATIDVKCIRREDNSIDFFVATVQDITERKLAEEEIKLSHQRLRQVIDIVPHFVFAKDISGRYILVNQSISDAYGTTTENLLGKFDRDFISPDEAENFRKDDLEVINSNKQKIIPDEEFTDSSGTVHILQTIKIPFTFSGTTTPSVLGVSVDITERKKAEAALKENEKKYRAIVEHSPNLFYSHTTDHVLTYLSPQVTEILGYSQKEALIKWTDLVTDNPINSIGFQNTVRAIETGTTQPPYELELKHKNGKKVIVEVWESPVVVDGITVSIVGALVDITPRKMAELSIAEKEKHYRSLFNLSPSGILIEDSKGTILDMNESFCKQSGYKPEELIGKNVSILGPQRYEREINQNIKKILDGAILEHDVVNKKKDGSLGYLQLRETAITLTDGTKGVLCVANDITERKKAEAQIQKSEENYRRVVNNIDEIIYLIEHTPDDQQKGKVIFVSEQTEKILGYKSVEFLNDSSLWFQLIHPDDVSLVSQITENAFKTKNSFFRTYRMKHKLTGQYIWIYDRAQMVLDDSGKIISQFGVALDITEQKEAREELIKAKEAAELSNKLKDAFIANMSHEIRTPLNGILGMKSLIQEAFSKYASADEEFYFNSIDRSSKRLMRTVDMILNFSRIQAGDFPINPKLLDLPSIITNLINEFKLNAQAKSVELSFVDKLEDFRVIADFYTVTQIIANLLDNAIKYTKIGFVKVVLYKNQENHAMIDIIDSGVGISEEYKQSLFKPYSQEEVGYNRSYEGIGLGLSIVKKFAEMNKAEITFKSKKDEGSIFTVHFIEGTVSKPKRKGRKKIETQNEKNLVSKETNRRDKTFVLVVEDDLTSQELIKTILKKYYQIVVVTSAQEAIEALKVNPFEIILMDISIRGDISGLELTKLLRKTAEYSEIPIIAVTAHAFPSDHQKSLEAGCNEYISKPFESKELLEKVRELIDN